MSKKAVNEIIHAKGYEIRIYTTDSQNEFLSLTDIAKYKSKDPNDVIKNWMRGRETLEFLGLWEHLHNPEFKPVEFDGFRKEAGLNAFTMSPTKWINAVNAIGVVSKAGRYGGTYAHSDIALEFASWISAEFKLYIVKDYQRIKHDENSRLALGWNLNQLLVLANMESYNAILIEQGKKQSERLIELRALAVRQMQTLNKIAFNRLPMLRESDT